MKNNNIFGLLIAACFLFVGIIAPLELSAQTASGKTDAFIKIFNSGNYHMKANIIMDNKVQSAMETFIKDGKMAIISTVSGVTSKVISKDGKNYTVMDSMKMVMVMPPTPQTPQIQSAGVDASNLTFVSSGTAQFNGKNLPYDEFSSGAAKAQYFYEGNNLAGIRNISSAGTIDIVILELNQNVPNNAFDIPSGYQVQDMTAIPGMQGLGR